jgi:hypothetical protein
MGNRSTPSVPRNMSKVYQNLNVFDRYIQIVTNLRHVSSEEGVRHIDFFCFLLRTPTVWFAREVWMWALTRWGKPYWMPTADVVILLALCQRSRGCRSFWHLCIYHHVSFPHTSEQNRIAKHKHRHLIEHV